MKAAVYEGPGRVAVREAPRPGLERGELLVRVHLCGVCGTDLKKIDHGLQPPPRIYGHEIAGTIAGTTAGEQEWQVGDRVVVHHHVPCRNCFYCARRLYAHCPGYLRTGVTAGYEPAGGGFAEYVRVMPWVRPGLVRIPPGTPDQAAAWMEPLNTVLKGVDTAAPQAGDTVLVMGQGPIGLLFTQVLLRRGCGVIAADLLEDRRLRAAGFGAAPLDPRAVSPADFCRAAAGGRGADLAVLAVPGEEAVQQAIQAVRPGGTVLLFAETRAGARLLLDPYEICGREKRILGSYSADIDLQPLAARMIFEGEIETASLVSHVLPLEQIGEALELARRPAPGTLKIMVAP